MLFLTSRFVFFCPSVLHRFPLRRCSFAQFEASVGEKEKAREIFKRADSYFRSEDMAEEVRVTGIIAAEGVQGIMARTALGPRVRPVRVREKAAPVRGRA